MLIGLIVFIATLIQAFLGFGGALIAMPLLVMVIGIQMATPVFALVGTLATLLNAVRLRDSTTPHDLVRLVVPAILGVPLGILLLARVDSGLITAALGVILIGYSLYNLLGLTMPPLSHPAWAWLAGFSSGVFSGAFNTGGPPVIVYATAQRWPADQFRGNLQTYFLIVSLFLVVGHGLSGHLTPDIWRMALPAVPALLVGQAIGVYLCRYIGADFFRKVVLAFLMLLGVQLIVT